MLTERRGYSLEAHAGSATLYLYGAVSMSGALAAMRECSDLPDAVWLLRWLRPRRSATTPT